MMPPPPPPPLTRADKIFVSDSLPFLDLAERVLCLLCEVVNLRERGSRVSTGSGHILVVCRGRTSTAAWR